MLGVQPNSPAAVGGLVSFFDFIVAAKGIHLATLDSTFVDLIKVRFPQAELIEISLSRGTKETVSNAMTIQKMNVATNLPDPTLLMA